MPTSAAPKLKHKKRKTDNRRSKGRRLSYEVQPALQNFMIPVVPDQPVILSELFSSVFGKRTNAHHDQQPVAVAAAAPYNEGIEVSGFFLRE